MFKKPDVSNPRPRHSDMRCFTNIGLLILIKFYVGIQRLQSNSFWIHVKIQKVNSERYLITGLELTENEAPCPDPGGGVSGPVHLC